MNKEFITCLEHIIDLEKTRMAQEKLLETMNAKMNKLGVRYQFKKPVMKQVELPKKTYSDYEGNLGIICAILIVLALFVYFLSTWEEKVLAILAGVFFTPLLAWIGWGIGMRIGESIDAKIEKREKEKEYRAAALANKRAYEADVTRYNTAVAEDEKRVTRELTVRQEQLITVDELKAGIQRTTNALNTYYEAAGIYELYRNIVAISYIHEYLKSGICSSLTGRDGAYMTYKYEMFERLKIERLDTVIDYLGQLHSDNVMLRDAVEYVADCVNKIANKMDIVIEQQKKAAEQRRLIQQQNALSLYNQECQTAELNHLNWLEYNRTYFM